DLSDSTTPGTPWRAEMVSRRMNHCPAAVSEQDSRTIKSERLLGCGTDTYIYPPGLPILIEALFAIHRDLCRFAMRTTRMILTLQPSFMTAFWTTRGGPSSSSARRR